MTEAGASASTPAFSDKELEVSHRVLAVLALAFGLGLSACGSGGDANTVRVCKVLTERAAALKAEGHKGMPAQLNVLSALVEEFEADPEKLRDVRAKADDATKAACPEARTAILEATGMGSLGELLS